MGAGTFVEDEESQFVHFDKTVAKSVKQNLVSRQDDADVLEHRVPRALVGPVVHIVLAQENLNAVAWQIGLENTMLLLT